MKKSLLITTILITLSLIFVTFYNYKAYSKKTNEFIIDVVGAIKENYPEVSTEEIVKIINDNKKYDENYLKEYGFTNKDFAFLKSMQQEYYHNLILSISIIIILLVIISTVEVRKEKRKQKELEEVIDYLKELNKGKYNLEIHNNSEGLMSILKNEIYTTTIMLREKAFKEEDDKKKLKDSLSDISHQLKTPLTSILIMLDTLIDENMDTKTRQEFLNDIRYQIENINFLIYAMLKLSRFDASVIKFNKEAINVQKLLIDCLKNIDIIRDLKDINIHIKGSETVTFKGDYKWQLEALTNIIKNSIEYTPEHKNIYVTFDDYSLYTKVTIEDEGPGISDEDINHIFERFYKGKNSSNNNFGIGLSLAKAIIEQDGGTIKVAKSKDKGTKFTIKYYH